jgi:two-component system, cell cycle sensor histidine kinase and response regulator CckA
MTAPLAEVVVLVVDDEAGVRSIAVWTLKAAGYAVVEAGDGLEAWTLFHREPSRYGMLLADVVMPRLPGTELAARVHGVRPELPVLLMTGYTPADLLARGLEATHGDLLTKPFSSETLLKAVWKALGGRGPGLSNARWYDGP